MPVGHLVLLRAVVTLLRWALRDVRLAAVLPRYGRWPFGPRRGSRSLLGRGHAGFGHAAAPMLVLDVSDVRCAGLRWAGLGRSLLSLPAVRELSVVGGCRVRTSDLPALLWAIQWPPMDFNCVWYGVCHGGDPMMRGRCCWLHGRCQISRRSNPNPSSAMLDAAPGERAEQRHCSAPSPSPLAPAATSSDHR